MKKKTNILTTKNGNNYEVKLPNSENKNNTLLRNKLNYLSGNNKNKIIKQFKGYNNYIQNKYGKNKYTTSNIFYDKKIKVEILKITF